MYRNLIAYYILLFSVQACAENHIFSKYNPLSIELCNVPNPHNKTCRLRENLYPRKLWNHWAGYSCYHYTNDYRLKFRYEGQVAVFKCDKDERIQIPVTLVDETFFWYDYTNATSLKYVKESFKTDDYFKIWKSCCKQAVECCDNFMNDFNIFPNTKYPCPAVWDAWSCFPPTKADTIKRIPCSDQAYSSTSKVCKLESEKECFKNGTWNTDTDYSVCAIAPVLRGRHSFHAIFLSVAIAFALPSVVIFLSYRKFRHTTRLILHRNLIIVIIVRNILTIVVKEVVILDALDSTDSNNVMDENGVPCRVLAFFESVAKNGIYSCMLIDGFYLHKSIVRVFAEEPKMIYLYGAVLVLSFLPSLVWAGLRGGADAGDCWQVDHGNDQWVIDGFRIAVLVINTLLLMDIIRVLLMKMKNSSTTQQAKAAFRATLFLIPLFGVHIVITADRDIIPGDTCIAEDIYYYLSYSLEALQGIMVAALFCYFSSEVHNELKNSYRKFTIYLYQTYGWDFRRNENLARRRTTAATYVDNTDRTSVSYSRSDNFLNQPERNASVHFSDNRVSQYMDESQT